MIRLTTAVLALVVSIATVTTSIAQWQNECSMALVIPRRHGVGFYAGQARSTKIFAAYGTIGRQGTITQSIITQSTITLTTITLQQG